MNTDLGGIPSNDVVLLCALVAAIGGMVAYIVLRKKRVADNEKPQQSQGDVPVMPQVPSDQQAAVSRIPELAERLRRNWTEATGDTDPMPDTALQIFLAQTWHESMFGGGWSGRKQQPRSYAVPR